MQTFYFHFLRVSLVRHLYCLRKRLFMSSAAEPQYATNLIDAKR